MSKQKQIRLSETQLSNIKSEIEYQEHVLGYWEKKAIEEARVARFKNSFTYGAISKGDSFPEEYYWEIEDEK